MAVEKEERRVERETSHSRFRGKGPTGQVEIPALALANGFDVTLPAISSLRGVTRLVPAVQALVRPKRFSLGRQSRLEREKGERGRRLMMRSALPRATPPPARLLRRAGLLLA